MQYYIIVLINFVDAIRCMLLSSIYYDGAITYDATLALPLTMKNNIM